MEIHNNALPPSFDAQGGSSSGESKHTAHMIIYNIEKYNKGDYWGDSLTPLIKDMHTFIGKYNPKDHTANEEQLYNAVVSTFETVAPIGSWSNNDDTKMIDQFKGDKSLLKNLLSAAQAVYTD